MVEQERLEVSVTDPRDQCEHIVSLVGGTALFVNGQSVFEGNKGLFARVLLTETLYHPDQPITAQHFKQRDVGSFASLVNIAAILNDIVSDEIGYYPWQPKFNERTKLSIPLRHITFFTTATNAMQQFEVPKVIDAGVDGFTAPNLDENNPKSKPLPSNQEVKSAISNDNERQYISKAGLWALRVLEQEDDISEIVKKLNGFDIEILHQLFYQPTGMTINEVAATLANRSGHPSDIHQVRSSMIKIFSCMRDSEKYEKRGGMYVLDKDNPHDGVKFFIRKKPLSNPVGVMARADLSTDDTV